MAMPEPRLASGIWVAAYLRRLQLEMIPVYVLARGDETAGAILVKLSTLDGKAQVFQRQYDLMTGSLDWQVMSEGSETVVDAVIARERARDSDVWVIELESRTGRHLLDSQDFGA
jgi:hypothetical protein